MEKLPKENSKKVSVKSDEEPIEEAKKVIEELDRVFCF